MVSTVQDRGYVSKETREGVEREYQKIEIINGTMVESTSIENTGAEKNKLFPTSGKDGFLFIVFVSDLCKGAVSAKAHTNGFAAFGVGAEKPSN
jgi:hypothetical protein